MKVVRCLELAMFIKDVIFQAHHRGSKEMDIILGSFVDMFIPNNISKAPELRSFLKHNDTDIHDWLWGHAPIPNEFKPFVRQLQQFHKINATSY